MKRVKERVGLDFKCDPDIHHRGTEGTELFFLFNTHFGRIAEVDSEKKNKKTSVLPVSLW